LFLRFFSIILLINKGEEPKTKPETRNAGLKNRWSAGASQKNPQTEGEQQKRPQPQAKQKGLPNRKIQD